MHLINLHKSLQLLFHICPMVSLVVCDVFICTSCRLYVFTDLQNSAWS